MRHEIEFGYHPDADQISAFVEHALPAHEQQQMLAHLAVCPECRATVAMSLPLENELATPAEQTGWIRWFTGWRLALPATAFAAITLLFFYIVRSGSSLRQPVNSPAQIAVSQPPASPAIRQPSTKGAQTLDQQIKPVESPKTSAEKAAKPRESITNSKQQVESTITNKLAVRQSVPLRPAASPTLANPPTEENVESAAQQPSVIPHFREPSEAKGAPQVAVLDGAVGGMTLKEAARNPALLRLPSGLPILSEATHLRQILAIDTQNNLFLSDDGGATWGAVPVQWKGHAVQANLVSHRAYSEASVIAGGSLQRLASPSLPPVPNPSTNAPAQASGMSLTGTISDPTGAVIPGATVTATASAGKVARTATSDANGRFMLDNLAPGVYDMKTLAPGFQQQLTQGVDVSATQPNVANVVLSVGAAAQTVEVQAANNHLETSHAPAFASAGPVNSVQAAPPLIFEIVTDSGEHWTSPDGMNWKRQ